MKELEAIKERAATIYVGATVPEERLLKVIADDVPKLIAALEAVDELSKCVSQQAVDKYNKARVLPPDERAVAAAAAVELEVIATDLLVAIAEALA